MNFNELKFPFKEDIQFLRSSSTASDQTFLDEYSLDNFFIPEFTYENESSFYPNEIGVQINTQTTTMPKTLCFLQNTTTDYHTLVVDQPMAFKHLKL